MRKKSPATIQKWVDSISVDQSEKPIEAENVNCDSIELKVDQPSTSSTNDNLKGKINEICSKLSVKGKKLELKNLLTKKVKRESSRDSTMEQKNDDETKDEDKLEDALKVQRQHIGALGRSSSENPNPTRKRLTEIGRSFSVANDSELQANETSAENLIFDADEDISITIPSITTSPSVISNNTNHSLSNSQLVAKNLLHRPARAERTVSEGAGPHFAKNPLLRDSSFQVI